MNSATTNIESNDDDDTNDNDAAVDDDSDDIAMETSDHDNSEVQDASEEWAGMNVVSIEEEKKISLARISQWFHETTWNFPVVTKMSQYSELLGN